MESLGSSLLLERVNYYLKPIKKINSIFHSTVRSLILNLLQSFSLFVRL